MSIADQIAHIKSDLENIARETNLLSKSSRLGFPSMLDGNLGHSFIGTSINLDEGSVIEFKKLKNEIV